MAEEGTEIHRVLEQYISGQLSYPEACKALADKGVQQPGAMIAAIFADEEDGE